MDRLSIDPKKLTKGKLIGQGGFGTVYRGTYAKAPESAPLQVAIKVLNTSADLSSAKFNAEASLLEQDELDTTAGSGLSYAVMVQHSIDICRGLQELHEMRIIVRDLKPDNVLVGENGTAVLSDFGLAKIIMSKSGRGSSTRAAGTFAYQPPEVFDRDMGPTTEKVDIWALGCVMIAMSGGGPFPDDMSGPAIGHQLCNKRASPKLGPSHRFGKSVEQIVAQCLTIDAAGRPTANQLLQMMQTLAGNQSSHDPNDVAAALHAMAMRTPRDSQEYDEEAAEEEEEEGEEEEGEDESGIEAARRQEGDELQAQLTSHLQQFGANWVDEAASALKGWATVPSGMLGREDKERCCYVVIARLFDTLRRSADEQLARFMVRSRRVTSLLLIMEEMDVCEELLLLTHLTERCFYLCGEEALQEWCDSRNNWASAMSVMNAKIDDMLGMEEALSNGTELAEIGLEKGNTMLVYLVCKEIINAVGSIMVSPNMFTGSAHKRRSTFAQLGGYIALVKCLTCENIGVCAEAVRTLNFTAMNSSTGKSQRLQILRNIPNAVEKLQQLANLRGDEAELDYAPSNARKLLEHL
ncbi:hypothetical protein WJX79_006692 [Trebouxia sp. C0005]